VDAAPWSGVRRGRCNSSPMGGQGRAKSNAHSSAQPGRTASDRFRRARQKLLDLDSDAVAADDHRAGCDR